MLKHAHFFENTVKKSTHVEETAPNPRWPAAAGGSAPRSPRCYYRLRIITYKKNNYCFFQSFAPIFHFKLCSFC